MNKVKYPIGWSGVCVKALRVFDRGKLGVSTPQVTNLFYSINNIKKCPK